MMTSKGTSWRDSSPGWDARSLDSSFTIGAPYCDAGSGWATGINPTTWCNFVAPGWRNSWGKGSQLNVSFEAGGNTRLVSLRKQGRATVSFADGHVSARRDTQLAEGTNYRRDILPADLRVTDKEKYLWDAD